MKFEDKKKNIKLQITRNFFLILLASFNCSAFASSKAEKLMQLKALETSESTQPVQADSTLKKKMIAFDFGDDYECPVFSNSPYTEALQSIEKMQSQINRVFPPCDNDQKTQELTNESKSFRDRIQHAQKLKNAGMTSQLPDTIKSVLFSAQKIQDLLSVAAGAPASVCAQSNQLERRSVIFQINETFQTLTPVVLDLVTQVPGLATALGPSLKVLVGVEGISKNISMIESLIKDSEIFDMKNSSNRKNTVKNVCHFMKLYRRLKYLRYSRLGKAQQIISDFESRIEEKNQSLKNLKGDNRTTMSRGESTGFRPMAAAAPIMRTTDPTYEPYTLLTSDLNGFEKAKNFIQRAQEYSEVSLQRLKAPELSQCLSVQKEMNRKIHKDNVDAILNLSNHFAENQIDLLVTSITAYGEKIIKIDLNDQASLEHCVSIGKDWFDLHIQAYESAPRLILLYENKMVEDNGKDFYKYREIILKKKIKRAEEDKANASAEKEKIKALFDVASFESSEVEKNARGLYRFFLDGPNLNEIISKSFVRKLFVKGANHGPVYGLLNNNSIYFDDSIKLIKLGLKRIQNLEDDWTLKKFNGRIPTERNQFNEFISLQNENRKNLGHITLKNYPIGTSEHRLVCSNTELVIDNYLQAVGYLSSSEQMCNMIGPAMHEEEVSSSLKAFCEVTSVRGWVTPAKDRQSDIDQMYSKIVCDDGECQTENSAFKTPSRLGPSAVTEVSIKSVIENLMERHENLNCEKN